MKKPLAESVEVVYNKAVAYNLFRLEGRAQREEDNMAQEKKAIYRVTLTAVFAALVFVSSMLSVPIPVAIGDVTRIHLGNIFCLLSGFVLGPVAGGLAAGLGSALYDLTNPAYITGAPFTFVFKFLLAAVCGWVAYARGSRAERHGQNILAGVAGSAAYMVLYLGKSFIEGLLLGNALVPVLVAVGTKAVTSGGERRDCRGGIRAAVRGCADGIEEKPPVGKVGITSSPGCRESFSKNIFEKSWKNP